MFCLLQFFYQTSQPYSIHSISLAFRTCFKRKMSRDSANTMLTTNFDLPKRNKKYQCSEQLKQPFLFER